MTTQEIQFAQYLNSRRQAMIRYVKIQNYISIINAAIAAGIDPSKHPEYHDIYNYLISELGDIFITEENTGKFKIHKEEDQVG